jgi:SAM-dependent methyltransferase
MVQSIHPPRTPDPIRYLDSAAASAAGRDYKRQLLDALDIRPGQVALDVGCGPGTDLADLATAVTDAGSVIGIDHDPVMIEEARRRLSGYRHVTVRAGDAHALPLDDDCVDRARLDRVLQHLEDPARALAELARVIRPDGVLGMAEPDWGTLMINDPDAETSTAFTRFLAGRVRNGTIGRRLAALAVDAGFTVRVANATAVVFRDFETAEQILGLRRNAARAVNAGKIDEAPARQWLDRLMRGPFLSSFTFFTVTAQAG